MQRADVFCAGLVEEQLRVDQHAASRMATMVRYERLYKTCERYYYSQVRSPVSGVHVIVTDIP